MEGEATPLLLLRRLWWLRLRRLLRLLRRLWRHLSLLLLLLLALFPFFQPLFPLSHLPLLFGCRQVQRTLQAAAQKQSRHEHCSEQPTHRKAGAKLEAV